MKNENITIDLHIHTDNSDGCHSIKEVLQIAEDLRNDNDVRLGIISITDHDDIRALKEIESNKELHAIYGGIIIPGVELSFVYNNGLYDVLGYGIDLKVIDKFLNRYSEEEKINFQRDILKEFKQVCDENRNSLFKRY